MWRVGQAPGNSIATALCGRVVDYLPRWRSQIRREWHLPTAAALPLHVDAYLVLLGSRHLAAVTPPTASWPLSRR